MKTTEYGLMIDIEDLEKILERAKQNAKYDNVEEYWKNHWEEA